MESGEELPGEITRLEILPRLPAKSLMRFKCVCKSWFALTSNPSFVNAHQSFHSNKPTHLLLASWDKPTRQQHFFSVQINQEGTPTPPAHLLNLPTLSHDRICHAQSINGLVCLYLADTLFSKQNQTNYNHPVRIFNPCTRESIVLPHALLTSPTTHVTHHFGFSPLKNEYKVLQVQMFLPQDSTTTTRVGVCFMFNIFKLGTSSWTRVEVDHNNLPFHLYNSPFHRKNVCVSGAMHWIHAAKTVIVAFDIGDEKFRVIPLPEDYNCIMTAVHHPFGHIVEVSGCLGLIGDTQLMEQNMMELWILKDYQNQVWVKETITFPFLWREVGYGYPVPFGTIRSGELLLKSSKLSKLDPDHVRLHLYNMKSKSFRRSEIVLPAEWTFLRYNRLKLLASYDDIIVPLR